MKLIALFIAIAPLFGQQNDVSFWSRNKELSAFPWYFYGGKKVTVDARFNFDAAKTAGVCLGKKLGGESLTLIPEACGYIGKTNGYGPELLVLSTKGKISAFSQNQWLQGVGSPSYFYHWTDIQRKLTKNLSVGVGEQIFKEISDEKGQIDLGPSFRPTFGPMYFKIWPAWSIGPANIGMLKLFLGVGYAW